MRRRIKTYLDFDDTARKRRFLSWAGGLKGVWELDIQPRRNLRSQAQNRLYWSQLVEPFYEFLCEQDYEICDPEQAHSLIKEKFLRVPVANPVTGEIVAWRTRSTTELTVEEFSDLIEKATVWLADFFGLVVLLDKPATTVTSGPPVPRRMLEKREVANA